MSAVWILRSRILERMFVLWCCRLKIFSYLTHLNLTEILVLGGYQFHVLTLAKMRITNHSQCLASVFNELM